MTDLTRIKVARVLGQGTFWIPIVTSYFIFRDITPSNAYFLIGLYSISVVILEYPTGVIGDYFSHALSYKLGLLIISLTYLLLATRSLLTLYVLYMVMTAFGVSLISGSNDALLFTISKSFAKDFSQNKFHSITFSIIAISFGAWCYQFNKSLPFFLSSLSFFLAFVFILPVSYTSHNQPNGNIFSKAKEGLISIKKNSPLKRLIFYSAVITAFFLSFKWLFNDLFLNIGLSESLFGILISGLTLLTAIGAKYSKQLHINTLLVFITMCALIVITGLNQLPILVLSTLGLLFLCRGVITTKLEIQINQMVDNNLRASIISFKNLFMRLLSSAYLFVLGLSTQTISINTFITYTGIVIFIVGVFTLPKSKVK